MKRVVAVAACALGLAGCSSMPSWMQFDTPKPAPVATTMQFESEPAGAEARTSAGQSCRTPCSLAVTANEFTVTFTLPGHQPQTVPVRVVAPSSDPRNASTTTDTPSARLVPNPVFVELQSVAPPPSRRPAVARARPKPNPAPAPARPRQAPTAMAPQPAPAPAPASPWPPPPAPR